MRLVAGVDLGGTAVNYTLLDQQEKFLIDGLCEHPALVKQGPEVCLRQIADGLKIAADKAGVLLSNIVAVGLDTPGPASAAASPSSKPPPSTSPLRFPLRGFSAIGYQSPPRHLDFVPHTLS